MTAKFAYDVNDPNLVVRLEGVEGHDIEIRLTPSQVAKVRAARLRLLGMQNKLQGSSVPINPRLVDPPPGSLSTDEPEGSSR